MRIDAHQHFWNYQPTRDVWITPEMQVLRQDFLPPHLGPLLSGCGFEGCVTVQADQSMAETNFLLTLAGENDWIKGVVGWIDLRARDLPEQLASCAQHEKLKGFRHIVQGEPKGFLLQPDFISGVKMIGRQGYTYDLLIYPHQLAEALVFARQLPDQKIVVDHLAKPNIKSKEFAPWAHDLHQLAQLPNVWCKISGMVTEADWGDWQASDFAPYLAHALECFGIDRLIYGSDWPVCLLAASYEHQLESVVHHFEPYSVSDKQKLFGENAERFYNLRT